MFKLNDKVVYPGHGVAKISRILKKKIAGSIASFFELKFIHKSMTILVPVDNAKSVGIRTLSSQENLDAIFTILSQPLTPINHEVIVANWNKRNKEYLGKIRTGDLREIGVIYRDLRHAEMCKELSFGERNLLTTTEALLAEEIALVQDVDENIAINQIRSVIINRAL